MLLLLTMACLGKDRPPDVVLVLVDTLRADALGVAGAPHPSTPFLDLMAREEWAAFSQAYACSSWTLPSTVCLFTGQLPWEHRVVRDSKSEHLYGRLGPEVPTLASALRAQGYRTGAFVNNTFMAPEFGLGSGFQTYDYVGASNEEHRRADQTVADALAWLDQGEGPALLVVHLMEPHADYTPAPEDAGRFTGGPSPTLGPLPLGTERVVSWMMGRATPTPEEQRYVRAAYQEEVLAVDRATQALVEGLRARGRWQNTRFVFTADHGEELWDYGGYEHGHTTRSAVTHIPLLVAGPGVKAGYNNSVVSHVDMSNYLLNGSGAVGQAAAGGPVAERVAISQDTLYTPQQVSITDGRRRLLIQLDTLQAALYGVDAQGLDTEVLSNDPARRAEGEVLYRTLVQIRGGLEPTAPVNPSLIEDSDTFENLRALGYIQE